MPTASMSHMPTCRKRRAGRGEGGPSGPPPVTKARLSSGTKTTEFEVGQGPQGAQGYGLSPFGSAIPDGPLDFCRRA